MNLKKIGTLTAKDFNLFFKNRFFLMITLLGLSFYILVYFLVPSSVDEVLEIGLHAPDLELFLENLSGDDQADGLELRIYGDEAVLKTAIIDGDIIAGVSIPAGSIADDRTRFKFFTASDLPSSQGKIIETLFTEMLGVFFEQNIRIRFQREVMGTDMAGMQLPPRSRMRPMLAFLLIMFESLGLASLITEEVERGTLTAVMITPIAPGDVFISKAILGVGLAFFESVFLMTVLGGLASSPLLILLLLFIGSILVTGVAFLIGSLARDFLSVMGLGILFFIIFMLPTFATIFPSMSTGWIRIIPTYYLVDALHQVSGFQAGWAEVRGSIGILALCAFGISGIGALALRRKVQ